jgi:ABC-type transporter Mla subunit MlaD
MSMLERLAGMTGADLPAAVKTATDGIANLNANLERIAENSAAIAARLDAQDRKLGEVLARQEQALADVAALNLLLMRVFGEVLKNPKDGT